MKHPIFFVFLNLFCLSLNLSSQDTEDLQWLIRDGKGKDGLIGLEHNYYTSPIPNGFALQGVANPSIGTLTGPAENSFFAIFDNGDYGFYVDYAGSTVNYKFDSDNVEYLYLTKKYEEDNDPPQNVRVSPYNGTGLSFNSNYRFTNHDIVDKNDITFILDSSHLPPICTLGCTLIFEVLGHPALHNQIVFEPSGLDGLNLKNAFFNQTDGHLDLDFNLSNDLVLPAITDNLFANFRVSLLSPELVGKQIIFKIGEVPDKILDTISVSGRYHDPNYVELQCVWNEDGQSKAKYRVECFNEGISYVSPISLSLDFPNYVNVSTLEILEWQVGVNNNCRDCGATSPLILPSLSTNNGVVFDFMNDCGLDGMPPASEGKSPEPTPSNIAWIEFCVDLNVPESELSTIPLQPFTPQTTFHTTDYAIVDFIDHTECIVQGENGCQMMGRNVTEKCDRCQCCTSCWCKIKRWLQNLF